MMKNSLRSTIWAMSLLWFGAQTSAAPLRIEQLVDIKHPSGPLFSPDGSRIAFLWDRAGQANLYVADVSGREVKPRALTKLSAGQPGGVFWSADGGSLYYSLGGDLWEAPVAAGGESLSVWRTPASETSITPSPDLTRGFRAIDGGHRVERDCRPIPQRGCRDEGHRRTRRSRRAELVARWSTTGLHGHANHSARRGACVFRIQDHLHHHRACPFPGLCGQGRRRCGHPDRPAWRFRRSAME